MVLRPIIQSFRNFKYPLIDNPFYTFSDDSNSLRLKEEEALKKVLLVSEQNTKRLLGLEGRIIQSAIIFGSITGRYTKRKIKLNPNSDLDLYVHIKDYFSSYDEKRLEEFLKANMEEETLRRRQEYYSNTLVAIRMLKNVLRQNITQNFYSERKKREEEQKNSIGEYKGIFSLSLDLHIDTLKLGEWEERQGIGFYIENFYPIIL